MQPVYHSFLTIPILSLFNGIILLTSFYYLGELLQKKFKIKKIVEEVSEAPFQNILISVSFFLIIIYPVCLFFPYSNIIIKFLSIIFFIFGIVKIFQNLKYFNVVKVKKKLFILDLDYQLFVIIFLGLALLSFAPVTNADSLDYHLFSAKYLLQNGGFPTDLTNFHSSRLFGAGEIMIALGLVVGSEQFGALVQLSGLLSILGILKKFKVSYIFYIILLSSPVLIFFISSIKPQLFSICSSAFVFALIFFKKDKKDNFNYYDKKKIIIIISLLFLSTQIKFSFFLSAFLLILFLFIENLKIKKIIQLFKIILPLYLLIIFPSIIWKYNNFGGNFIELFYSPFETSLYGLDFFKYYLTILSERNIYWFVFPTSISNITHSLGLGSLMIICIFNLKKNIQKYYILSMIFIFIVISYYYGQFTARFMFEPYMWTTVYLIKFHKEFNIIKYYKYAVRLQAIMFIGVVFYGVIHLTPGVINSEIRDKVLERSAIGYKFFKWVNFQLKNEEGAIISFDRSISFSKNYPISRDHIFFVNMSKPEAKKYIEEIQRINPKYIVFAENTTTYKKYEGCMTKLFKYGKNVYQFAVRNPRSKSSVKHDAYIYEIDTKLMPDCINPNQVDPYARQ